MARDVRIVPYTAGPLCRKPGIRFPATSTLAAWSGGERFTISTAVGHIAVDGSDGEMNKEILLIDLPIPKTRVLYRELVGKRLNYTLTPNVNGGNSMSDEEYERFLDRYNLSALEKASFKRLRGISTGLPD